MRWQVSRSLRSGPFGSGHYGVRSGGVFVAALRVLHISPEACRSPYEGIACLDLGKDSRVCLGDPGRDMNAAWKTEIEKVLRHDTMAPLISEILNTGHVSPKTAKAWLAKNKRPTDHHEVFQAVARAESKWDRVKAIAEQRARKNLGRMIPWAGLADLLFEEGMDGAAVKGFAGVPDGRIVTHEAVVDLISS